MSETVEISVEVWGLTWKETKSVITWMKHTFPESDTKWRAQSSDSGTINDILSIEDLHTVFKSGFVVELLDYHISLKDLENKYEDVEKNWSWQRGLSEAISNMTVTVGKTVASEYIGIRARYIEQCPIEDYIYLEDKE